MTEVYDDCITGVQHVRQWCTEFENSCVDRDDDYRAGQPSNNYSTGGGTDFGKSTNHNSRLSRCTGIVGQNCKQHWKASILTAKKFCNYVMPGGDNCINVIGDYVEK
jgi:hypothetical protein